MKANRGYVVVAAWENTSEGRGGAPQNATIAPGYDYDKNTGCMVANVGKENGIKRTRGKYFNMIHSCGNLEADDTSKLNVSWVALSDNKNKGFHYHQGFFLRILKGPFRHWGKNIQLEKDSNSIGKVQLRRIYLWY